MQRVIHSLGCLLYFAVATLTLTAIISLFTDQIAFLDIMRDAFCTIIAILILGGIAFRIETKKAKP